MSATLREAGVSGASPLVARSCRTLRIRCPFTSHSSRKPLQNVKCTSRESIAAESQNLSDLLRSTHQPPHLNRRTLLTSLTACAGAALASGLQVRAEEVKFTELRDNDIGYSITIPEGWSNEAPGGKLNFYPPHDYAGKRVSIEFSSLGKKLDLDLAPVLGSPEQYGQAAVQGMETELLSTSQSEGGRYYYYEYTLPSFKPNRVWGIAGVGLGPNPTARQYNRKQLVKVTCMVPEEDLERDGEVMRRIVSSFHFLE